MTPNKFVQISTYGEGKICFSHGKPVAAYTPALGYFRTDTDNGRMPNAHAKQFCGKAGIVLPALKFNQLVSAIVGGLL